LRITVKVTKLQLENQGWQKGMQKNNNRNSREIANHREKSQYVTIGRTLYAEVNLISNDVG